MIELRAMTVSGFDKYKEISLPAYAESKRKGEGLTHEQAMKIAEESFQQLLPEGVKTPDHYLYDVIETKTGDNVGTLWFARQTDKAHPYAWVYDIVLKEDARGQGYGRRTMELLEKEVHKLGLKSIALHVFGFNEIAQKLYRSLGFKPTNITMAKDL